MIDQIFKGSEESLKKSFLREKASLIDCWESLKKEYEDARNPLWLLPFERRDLAEMAPFVERFQDNFEKVIVFGTGGSSLGAQSLIPFTQNMPELLFMDNIDPLTMDQQFAEIEHLKTGILVISKSGSTAETVAQFLAAVRSFEEEVGRAHVKDHFLVITEEKQSPIDEIAKDYEISIFPHDPNVGGRFSVLSNVGMLPFLIGGGDGLAVRKGAGKAFDQLLYAREIEDIPAVQGALFQLLNPQKYPINVLFSYCDALKDFTYWHRQLWAESIGKERQGTTPVPALGPVDQHSQLQLYLEGPLDKTFTFLTYDHRQHGPSVGKNFEEKHPLHYLSGAKIGELMAAEFEATIQTFEEKELPIRILSLSEVSPESFGALFMHFMLETIFAAAILKVNPYNQPAVEQGKILTREIMEKRLL